MIDADTPFSESRLLALKDRAKLDEMIAALDEIVAAEYASLRAGFVIGWTDSFDTRRMRRAVVLEKTHDFLRDMVKPNEREIGEILRRASYEGRRRA